MLGALGATHDDIAIALPGAKERTLLALLLARANRVVSVDELVEGLWGEAPPPTAEKSLQAHVVRLRDALEPDRPRGTPGSLIFTVGAGYVLRCGPESLDSQRFERLAFDGRQALVVGAATTASHLLSEALGIWRGTPFAEHAAEALERERSRLIEIERTAREDLAQSRLELGQHRELVPELEQTISDDPLRERAWAQLMLALYRAGRQAEALAAFHRARDVLDAELGIEPGADLQRLQRQVLEQDPSLLNGVTGSTQRGRPPELANHDDPFVGRDAELARLAARWDSAQDSGRSWVEVVHIHGPDGIGRTRLIAEFVDRSAGDAALVYASGVPRTSKPLAVFERLASAAGFAIADDDHPTAMGESLGRAIARMTRDDPFVVILDDLDSSDDSVLEALAGFRTGLHNGRGLIIITGAQSLSSHIAPKTELRLAPLAVGETIALVARYTGDAAADLAAAQIAPSARGIPGLVHAEAAEWARRQARSDIDVAARKVAAERSNLGLVRTELRARIVDLQAVATFRPASDSIGAAPYKGLSPFSVDDSGIFFGRELVVGRLAARLVETPLVVLVGSSGSGKSSLARAGLVAALSDGVLPGSETWLLRQLEVGRLDCAELVPALEEASRTDNGSDHVLLLVDQLEQLFAVCDHKPHRRAFLDRLAELAADPKRRISTVATLRSDYFGHLADSPAFALAASEASEVIAPMTADEIQRAIELPAQRAGAHLEAGLSAAIAADAYGRAGSLPLLSTAMLELWESRSNGTLTWSAYRSSGGIAGAVARLAEDCYGRFSSDEQAVARRILLRTVGAAEDRREMSRRVPLDELATEGEPGRKVLASLSDRRLMTVDNSAAEVTHEAIYQQWPRLRAWLDEDNVGRDIHRHLIASSRDWHERGRESSDLLRGARLVATTEWAQAHDAELNEVEHEFVAASIALEERDAAGERERVRQTLRTNRRLKFAAVGLGVLVVATTVVGGVAFGQSEAANREQVVAGAARLGSTALVQPSLDRELLLAAAAYGIDNSIDTRGALLAALTRSPQTVGVIHGAPDERFLDMTVSPDGRYVAIGANTGTIAVWDWQARTRVALIDAAFEAFTIAYSSDGMSILAAEAAPDGWHIHRWSQADGVEMPVIVIHGQRPEPSAIDQVAFAKAAPVAVARSVDGSVFVVNLDSGEKTLVATIPVPRFFRASVAISQDGTKLAVTDDKSVRVFDMHGALVGQFDMTGDVVQVPVVKMAFSPDGRQLVLAADNGTLHLVDPFSGNYLLSANPHTGAAYDVAFTPDGTSILSGSEDNSVALWHTDTGRIDRFGRGHFGRVFGVGLTPDGKTAFSAAADNTLLVWDLAGQRRFGTRLEQLPPGAQGWASSTDGSKVAMAYDDGSVNVADLTAGTMWQVNPGVGALAAASFTHDGSRLAVAGPAGKIVVLDAATGAQLGEPIAGYSRRIGNLSYSPDDRFLAVAEEGSGWIVDMTSSTAGPELFTDTGAGSVAWSADGNHVAFGTYSGKVVVRDVVSDAVVGRFDADDVGISTVAWSADGSKLATGSASGAARLWSTRDWQPLGVELRAHANWVLEERFSDDGKWLATYGGDGAAAVWDVEKRRQLGAQLMGAQNEFGGMWLAPGAEKLVIYQTDGSIWSWPLDDATWLRDVCSIAGRDLTSDEWQTYAPGVPPRPVCPVSM